MNVLEGADLVDALYESALPCIQRFFELHEGETFFGFAVEILAEEGSFMLCAASVESFQSTIEEYLQTGEPMESILGEDIKWNNQEWKYFDFNRECQLWNVSWQPARNRIDAFTLGLRTLDDADRVLAQQKFNKMFLLAGKSTFEKIMVSGVLDSVRKTEDFRSFAFEHHEVF
ncbi:MAG: DUF4303 domain-containing protein [Pseudomonadota bacterium]|nr:DUF4303 domain-containing protein [Pseudomonadota bacterium]